MAEQNYLNDKDATWQLTHMCEFFSQISRSRELDKGRAKAYKTEWKELIESYVGWLIRTQDDRKVTEQDEEKDAFLDVLREGEKAVIDSIPIPDCLDNAKIEQHPTTQQGRT